MKNSPHHWVTIRYQDYLFDVQVLNSNYTIHEIRPIDSEINILKWIDSNTLSSIQHLIKENHHAI
jgi:hypothetical protein